MRSLELNKMSKNLVRCDDYTLKNVVGGSEKKTSDKSEKHFQEGGTAIGIVAGAIIAYAWIKDVEKTRDLKRLNIFSRIWRTCISMVGAACVGGAIGRGIGHGVKKINLHDAEI